MAGSIYGMHRGHSDPRPGRRRALSIGIAYTMQPARHGFGHLVGPHRDAEGFRRLLIDCYGYKDGCITVMLDKPGYKTSLMPTKENILRQIRKLVKGAKPGDCFVFHYSGHSGQIPSEDHDEDDDLDEVIIPMNHEGLEAPDHDKLILDNELRDLLVDSLPVGVQLTAIFDSCTSGTLLDLDHYECNQTYTPWVSKGIRKPDSWRRNVVRRNTVFSVPFGRIHHLERVTDRVVKSRTTSIEVMPAIDGTSRRVSLKTSTGTLNSLKSPPQAPSPLSIAYKDTDLMREMSDDNSSLARLVIPRCMSPMSNGKCTGYCPYSPTLKPTVVSLSACKDGQTAWESYDGKSMTQVLIEVLQSSPHPTFKQLMTEIGHRIYDTNRKLHDWTRRKRAKMQIVRNRNGSGLTATVCEEVEGEMVNFQDPQLGSQERLHMESRFTL